MIKEKKIRLRSNKELEVQNEGLLLLKGILEKINVTYYLSSGTLLGAIREKNFIRWDWDVQMYLLMENAYPIRGKITKILKENGFKIKKFYDSRETLKWSLKRKKIIFELTAWYQEDSWRFRKYKQMRVPAYLFKNQKTINFKGNKYWTFSNPKKYLEFCYGDWKTPKRTSDKTIYATSKHMGVNNFSNRLFILFRKLFLNLKNL